MANLSGRGAAQDLHGCLHSAMVAAPARNLREVLREALPRPPRLARQQLELRSRQDESLKDERRRTSKEV